MVLSPLRCADVAEISLREASPVNRQRSIALDETTPNVFVLELDVVRHFRVRTALHRGVLDCTEVQQEEGLLVQRMDRKERMALQEYPAHGEDELLEVNTEDLDHVAKFDF